MDSRIAELVKGVPRTQDRCGRAIHEPMKAMLATFGAVIHEGELIVPPAEPRMSR